MVSKIFYEPLVLDGADESLLFSNMEKRLTFDLAGKVPYQLKWRDYEDSMVLLRQNSIFAVGKETPYLESK